MLTITISLSLKSDISFLLSINYCTCIVPYSVKVIQGYGLLHFFPWLNLWFNFIFLPHFLPILQNFIIFSDLSLYTHFMNLFLSVHQTTDLAPQSCFSLQLNVVGFFLHLLIFTFCLSYVMLHRRGVPSNSTTKDADFRC